MKRQLEHVIKSTHNAFMLNANDKRHFYDLTLSLIAWKALSTEADKGGQLAIQRCEVPDQIHYFDLVMQHTGTPQHKKEVERSLAAWEEANMESLSGLIKLNRNLIQEIPDDVWQYICDSWTNFFTDYLHNYSGLGEFIAPLMDMLEISLSKDRLIFENYTPRELVGLMAHLLGDSENKSLYDPYCWSGSLLSVGAQSLKGLTSINGFTVTGLPWKLAKLRLLLSPTRAEVRIEKGFNYDLLPKKSTFDLIIMNPPYGRGDGFPFIQEKSNSWAQLADGSGRIDLALVCHALDRLSSRGRAAILVPAIFLSGQGALQAFRSRIIQQNILAAVISLPPWVFPQTGVTASILLFDNRKRDKKVFMLDVSKLIKDSKTEVSLDEEAINYYLRQYSENSLKTTDHCRVLNDSEIESNDFDLKLSSYVRTEQILANPYLPSRTLQQDCIRLLTEWEHSHEKIKTLVEQKQIISKPYPE